MNDQEQTIGAAATEAAKEQRNEQDVDQAKEVDAAQADEPGQAEADSQGEGESDASAADGPEAGQESGDAVRSDPVALDEPESSGGLTSEAGLQPVPDSNECTCGGRWTHAEDCPARAS